MALREAQPRRAHGLIGNTRRLVLLIAGGLIAGVVVWAVLLTSAVYTEESKSSGNDVSAGEARLSVSPTGPIVAADGLKPGDVRQGDAMVTNLGSPARLSVTVKGAAAAPALAAAVMLEILDRDTPSMVFYSGPLGGAGRVDLGAYGAGATKAVRIKLSLPSSASPSLSGQSVAASFEWEARAP